MAKRKHYANEAEDKLIQALPKVREAYPNATISYEKHQGSYQQSMAVTKTEGGKTERLMISYLFFRQHTIEQITDRILKGFQKRTEASLLNPFNEWQGFRDPEYNWCIMIYEHWVDLGDDCERFGEKLDGTSECFMRIYCTRAENYNDSVEWAITYLKSTFLSNDNWYEIKVYKGNTRNRPLYRIQLRSEGEIWEDKTNAEKQH